MAVDDIRLSRNLNFNNFINMLHVPTELSEEWSMSTDSYSKSGEINKKSTIHSGSFMVSRVHDVNVDEDDEEQIRISPFDFDEDTKGFNFINASKETHQTYNFGNDNKHSEIIDASLTKLFQCMTLAYR